MNKHFFPLSASLSGKEVTVVSICGGKGIISKLAEMGLFIGSKLKALNCGHKGQSLVLSGSTKLAIGGTMARRIMVTEE